MTDDIKVGDRVRSHDFGKDRGDRPPCYVEGVVEKIGPFPACGESCPHYHIRIEKRVFRGTEDPPERMRAEFKDGYAYPALNYSHIEKVA